MQMRKGLRKSKGTLCDKDVFSARGKVTMAKRAQKSKVMNSYEHLRHQLSTRFSCTLDSDS